MPTFSISRTSHSLYNADTNKEKIKLPCSKAYIKEQVRPDFKDTWYYCAIDLEWSELPSLLKEVDYIILTESGDEELFDIEIYDDYRE